jgi:hypothetical protein
MSSGKREKKPRVTPVLSQMANIETSLKEIRHAGADWMKMGPGQIADQLSGHLILKKHCDPQI